MIPRGLVIALILVSGCASVLGDDPKSPVEPPTEPKAIDWSSLLAQSLGFLGIEHSFRWVTEEGTRHPHRSFFDGYVDSLNSLHGWGDGDPFYVSYVGHPMQGAVVLPLCPKRSQVSRCRIREPPVLEEQVASRRFCVGLQRAV